MVLYSYSLLLALITFMNFQPTTPFVFFGYFDILLLLVILFSGFIILKFNLIHKVNWKINLIRYFALFILCPYYSCKVEANSVHRTFEVVDGFNLLYILFRWPTWWMIGILLILVFDNVLKHKVALKRSL